MSHINVLNTKGARHEQRVALGREVTGTLVRLLDRRPERTSPSSSRGLLRRAAASAAAFSTTSFVPAGGRYGTASSGAA
jgi:hypothetical protein